VYVYAQAFVVAFKIPNSLRDMIGEGAANAAFVPVFSEYRIKHTQEEFWELVNVILNLLLVILALVVLLGIILSPLIVRLIAPGFIQDPYKLETTIRITRILFPYILLISLSAYAVSILNTLKHFSIPAFAPCLLNISIIVFIMLFGEDILGLTSGVLVGGVLQLLIQVPVLYKKGFCFKGFLKRFKHPTAKLIGKLMLPRLFSSCIYQLNNFVDTIFGSLALIVGEGGVAVLYFAYRLILFPLGIFSTALSQAILPTFSEQALEDSKENLRRTLSFGLRATFLVMMPASIGFMVLSRMIIQGLFEGGRFDAYSTTITARVLFFYSLGLFAYGANRILNSCFFSLKDTITPAKVAFLSFILNIILNSFLMFPLKISGLALATSISGISTFLILFYILKKRLAPFNPKAVYTSFLRILLASICMGLVVFFIFRNPIVYETSGLYKVMNLSIAILCGLTSYIIFCFVFRVNEVKEFWQWLTRRKL